MSATEIVIVGAGMTGLACAQALRAAGHAPLVLDKGRGIGGRLATRRAGGGLTFDHGAQYVTARSEGFRAVLADMQAAGIADVWQDGTGRDHIVGVPGMSALARHLSGGLEIRQSVEVTTLQRTGSGWQISVGDGEIEAARVVLAIPAPQVAALLGPNDPLAEALGDVQFAPCLTLMAAFRPGQPTPFRSARVPDAPLAWIARNSTKPGRGDPVTWVAQAGPDWSAAHLERDRDQIARLMLPMLAQRLGADPAAAAHAVAHRWRYAAVTVPLGRTFARHADGTLWAGGDWCLEARVEAAWTSGTAIAGDMLAGT